MSSVPPCPQEASPWRDIRHNRSFPVGFPSQCKPFQTLKPVPWDQKENMPEPATKLIRIRSEEIGVNINPIKNLLEQAVRDTAFPGGVMLAAKDGNIFLHEAVGYHTYSKRKAISKGNIFDLASITKVVSTTSALMNLIEEGKLNLDDKVVRYVPEFIGKQ